MMSRGRAGRRRSASIRSRTSLWRPWSHGRHRWSWGGTALFIAGHATFKIAVWRVMPWSRLAAAAMLGLLDLAVPYVSLLGLGACATAVVIAVAALDHYQASHPGRPAPG